MVVSSKFLKENNPEGSARFFAAPACRQAWLRMTKMCLIARLPRSRRYNNTKHVSPNYIYHVRRNRYFELPQSNTYMDWIRGYGLILLVISSILLCMALAYRENKIFFCINLLLVVLQCLYWSLMYRIAEARVSLFKMI